MAEGLLEKVVLSLLGAMDPLENLMHIQKNSLFHLHIQLLKFYTFLFHESHPWPRLKFSRIYF